MKALNLISLFLCVAFTITPALGQVTFDENGNGVYDGQPLSWGVGIPPVQGVDQISTLYYILPGPGGVVEGDLQILEPGITTLSDVLRFIDDPTTNTARVYVYSDTDDPVKSLADVGIPQPWLNVVTVPEIVFANGSNGVIYTPGPGQPGGPLDPPGQFIYQFTSDIPEPATVCLLGLGALGLLKKRRA